MNKVIIAGKSGALFSALREQARIFGEETTVKTWIEVLHTFPTAKRLLQQGIPASVKIGYKED